MKKILLLTILTAFLLCSAASAAPIYTYEESIPISKSITLTKAEAFYADHNISYSCIKADLSDENTALKLLKSEKGTDVMDTVGNLARTEKNVAAALNADFFSAHKGNQGFALGVEIKDGALLESPINPSTMATVSYMDQAVTMSYLDFHIMAVAPNGQYNEIRHLNKHTAYFGDILMYTAEFNGGLSPAPGGEVLEVVVSNGIITEFRRNMPPVQIPKDGCVLVVSEGVNMFFANNFAQGDPIRFDYYITPDIAKADAAFGGGAMLVSEGTIPKTFSHVISGYNPRSAIGVDKSGKTLYLVAVNGRQEGSRGMSMRELAELMQSLGCYNAVNLDGGGSTNMVASTVWAKELHTVNSPTENRRVINAVGLTYEKEAGAPAGIILESDKEAVWVGEPIRISAAAHDANLRPAEGEIQLSSPHGTVENGIFTPTVGGAVRVDAVCQDATGSIELYAVDTVSGIEAPSHIRLAEGEEKTLSIHVFDSLGHYVPVQLTDRFTITSTNPDVAVVNGKTVSAKGSGTAILSFEKDGAVSYTSVAVGSKAERHTEEFEYLSGKFSAYPMEVQGAFSLSDKRAKNGAMSGKLAYDFSGTVEADKSAHFVLDTRPVLSETDTALSVYFYTETEFSHVLCAQFSNAGGILAYPFEGDYTKGKWQKLTLEIPASAPRPLRLDSVYVSAPKDATDSGNVYLDALTFAKDTAVSFATAPQNIYPQSTIGGETDFAVGALSGDETLLSTLINKRTREAVTAAKSHAFLGAIDGFRANEDENALYITLDTRGGGIRGTDASQWNALKAAIDKTERKNIVLLADASLFGSSDFENRVIPDYLASLSQNVFVITPGNRNTYKNIGGVQYFTLGTGSEESVSAAHLKSYQYLAFDFGTETAFTFKSLY